MKNVGYKLYTDGITDDEIWYDEPKKVTEERFKILTFTMKEWELLAERLEINLKENDEQKLYLKIMEAANKKADDEIIGIYDLYNWLNFGEYRDVDEDCVYFIDEIEEKPFCIWDGEASDDYGAGETMLDSDFYGVQYWSGSNWEWAFGDEYEEVKIDE